ncbi:hypothetical protein HGM15179_001352 [Zosterops borbonicus]|uniref:Uncharacterized protein n=1 Tax=Zosterops borbonicus TaxID=364589 RepID=A0A8K1GXP1_9PASS|nr:hypothetical protein HGM15179_001352 [Zosterops borbonicus]
MDWKSCSFFDLKQWLVFNRASNYYLPTCQENKELEQLKDTPACTEGCERPNLGPEAGTMWLHIGNFSENWSWIYLPDPRRMKTFNQYIVKEERIPKFFFYSLTTVNHPPWMSMPDSSLHIMEKVKLHSRETDKFRLDVHCWTHMDLMILRVFFDLSNSIIL